MDINHLDVSPDESRILEYLKSFPGEFVTAKEVARRADGKNRFQSDPQWAHFALLRLTESKLVETDGAGRFRLKVTRTVSNKSKAKFMDPKLREVLERSGRKFDLSGYA